MTKMRRLLPLPCCQPDPGWQGLAGKTPSASGSGLSPITRGFHVAGVVADIKNHGSNMPRKPEIYFCLPVSHSRFGSICARWRLLSVRFGARQIVGAIRGQLKQFDPELPALQNSYIEGACLLVCCRKPGFPR